MKLMKYILLVVIVVISCSPSPKNIVLKNPMFVTEYLADAGMDSIGFLMRKHIIVVTVKDKNELHVYGAMNGKFKKSIKRENAYPNGITTINDQFVLVTERDNKQVAVFNSSMDFLGTFGNEELRSPYGITFYEQENNSFKVLVTDSYEYNNPREDRILSWDFTIENEEFSVGPAKVLGSPTLYQVESIQADKHYQTLLVAEEMKEHHKIMALDLKTGEVIKEDLGNFDRGNDPEGIALVINKDNNGYWICTEQSKTDNRFHLYDRKTLEYKTTMYLDNVSYTDGIATAYMHGKWFLYAVDNDARIVAFELPEIN